MKTFQMLFAMLVVIFVSNVAMQAQPINTNPNGINTPIGMSTNPALNPCNFKPDLHFTNFTILYVTPGAVEGTGANQTRRYAVAYTAVVKNSGAVASVATQIEGQYSRIDQNNFFWGGCRNLPALAAGATFTVQGVIALRVPVTHNKAKVRMYADAPCAEEFLPNYVRVNECKESNNHSAIMTVNLF